MTADHAHDDADAAAHVSDALRTAFAEVGSASLAPEDRGRWQRRLLAITNTAKHDVHRAKTQLDKFHFEWNAARKRRNDETGC